MRPVALLLCALFATSATITEMPDSSTEAAQFSSPATWTKDIVGITPNPVLAHVDLDDKDVGRPLYDAFRKLVILRLQMIGPNLWDLCLGFASADTGSGVFDATHRFSKLITRKGLGNKCRLSTAPALRQIDVRFRVQNIILAFLPDNCSWRDDLEDLPPDRPILSFLRDLDDFYFTFDRQSMLRAQSLWAAQRWSKMQKLSDFFRDYHDLVADHQAQNDIRLDAENYWDQLVINLTTQIAPNPAESFTAFRHEMALINTDIKASNGVVTLSL